MFCPSVFHITPFHFTAPHRPQVSITNIHIRFEDDGHVTGTQPFSAGIELATLTATSANEAWEATGAPPLDITARKVR
jgi:hypothetical protein